MDITLTDKIALVTGAGRGIGQAIARALAAAGACVCVNDINPNTAEATAAAIVAAGGQAFAYVGDVAQRMHVQVMVDEIVARWGRIDILVNNAGVEPHAPLLDLDPYDWERTLAVNLTGTFLCTQVAGRAMRAQGGGAIVNIASIAGRAGGLRDRAAYVASKTGQVGFGKECARELAAYGIRVNTVCPGVIITEMTAHLRGNEEQMRRWLADIPQGRLGEVDDVAGLVVFLCSDAAAYITGQAIHVDGGKVMV